MAAGLSDASDGTVYELKSVGGAPVTLNMTGKAN